MKTNWYGRAGWLIMMFLATGIALFSLRFFLPDRPSVAPDILANLVENPVTFLLHVAGGLTALLLGPWQFLASIRLNKPKVHRWIGRMYVLAVLIGGTTGFFVAFSSSAGPWATAGFSILAILWLITTWFGYRRAVERRFDAHRVWMIRSFALTAAAITLRLGLPVAPALGYEFVSGYIVMSWASWLINLGIAEWYLRATGGRQASLRPVSSPAGRPNPA